MSREAAPEQSTLIPLSEYTDEDWQIIREATTCTLEPVVDIRPLLHVIKVPLEKVKSLFEPIPTLRDGNEIP